MGKAEIYYFSELDQSQVSTSLQDVWAGKLESIGLIVTIQEKGPRLAAPQYVVFNFYNSSDEPRLAPFRTLGLTFQGDVYEWDALEYVKPGKHEAERLVFVMEYPDFAKIVFGESTKMQMGELKIVLTADQRMALQDVVRAVEQQ